MEKGNAWTLLSASNKLIEGPLRLIRAILFVSTDGGDATLYDGMNDAGRKITQWKGLVNQPQALEFDIYCPNGIYYVEGSNVTSCLVVYDKVD